MNTKYLIFFMIIYLSIQPVAGVPITYKSYIDNDYGFYRVIDITTHHSSPYDINNHTLTINQGDTIIWENDALTNVKMTIVSEQKLWKDKDLRNIFDYTFNDPGTYNIHIREYPKDIQKIVVDPIYPTSTDITDKDAAFTQTPIQTTIPIAIIPIHTIPTQTQATISDPVPISDENTKKIMLMSVVAIVLSIPLIYIFIRH